MGKIASRFGPYGFVVGAAALLLILSGFSPIEAFDILIRSSWGSPAGLELLLKKTVPLILTGLAVIIPVRAGLFNIGGEGQLYLGGICAAIVGALNLGVPRCPHILLAVGAGVCAGAAWGGFAGYLRAKRGVHEVISTILLNFIALYLVNYLALGPLSAGEGVGRTAFIRPTAELWMIPFAENAVISFGFFISIACALLCHGLLYRTGIGWSTRALGENPTAAQYGGISVTAYTIGLMALAGGLAGLAGALETCGIHRSFYARFGSSYGFDGIAVAFLARAEPWAVIPAALFLSTLRTADADLQFELGIPKETVLILEGVLIVLIAILHQHERRKRLEGAVT
ncbi:MAG: ABC transporter permease [bacterium]